MNHLLKMLGLLAFVLIGLGSESTQVRPSSHGNSYFDVRQYYSNTSEFEANAIAQNTCAKHNAVPKLVNFKRGCMLACGSEFNYYTYQCISNQSIVEERQTFDTNSCSNWGFTKGTEAFANCMLRMHEVRIAVDNAAATNRAIREMTEQQRRDAERDQAYRLLNLSRQIQQQSRPQTITPFTCNRVGNFVNCQ